MASHRQGESECLTACPPPPSPSLLPPATPPVPILLPSPPHNLSPQSRIWLEWLNSRACLGFNKSLYQQRSEGRRGFVCVYLQVICKHEVLNTKPPECVLLEGFCSFAPSEKGNLQRGKMAPCLPNGGSPPAGPGPCDKCLHI